MPRTKIRFPYHITEQIREALLKCGARECGGILMGEHVGYEEFRILDLTIQSQAGTMSRFVRAIAGFVAKLAAFFERTGHRYQKYNYLGEWHSHPCFALQPSRDDYVTMRDIVDDPAVGAHFVVLLLVRLNRGKVESKAWTLLPGGALADADVISDGVNNGQQ